MSERLDNGWTRIAQKDPYQIQRAAGRVANEESQHRHSKKDGYHEQQASYDITKETSQRLLTTSGTGRFAYNGFANPLMRIGGLMV
jgi:hypothetical protein